MKLKIIIMAVVFGLISSSVWAGVVSISGDVTDIFKLAAEGKTQVAVKKLKDISYLVQLIEKKSVAKEKFEKFMAAVEEITEIEVDKTNSGSTIYRIISSQGSLFRIAVIHHGEDGDFVRSAEIED